MYNVRGLQQRRRGQERNFRNRNKRAMCDGRWMRQTDPYSRAVDPRLHLPLASSSTVTHAQGDQPHPLSLTSTDLLHLPALVDDRLECCV